MAKTKRNLPYWAEEGRGWTIPLYKKFNREFSDLHKAVDEFGNFSIWTDASIRRKGRRFLKRQTSRLRRRRMKWIDACAC